MKNSFKIMRKEMRSKIWLGVLALMFTILYSSAIVVSVAEMYTVWSSIIMFLTYMIVCGGCTLAAVTCFENAYKIWKQIVKAEQVYEDFWNSTEDDLK